MTGSTRFGTACRRLDSQVNPLLYPGPNVVNYGQRQAFRRALSLLDLDSVIDAYRAEEGRSEKGSDAGIGDPFKCLQHMASISPVGNDRVGVLVL